MFGSSKEKSSVMRHLNSQLGSTPFLAGGEVTLADIVAYPTLGDGLGMLKVTENVKSWMKRCRALPEFEGCPVIDFGDT